MKQISLLRCFLTQEEKFSRIKHITEKKTVVASLTHVRLCRPHTAHQIVKISKVKNIALILSISVFSLSNSSSVKKGSTLFTQLTHNSLMIMFIFSGKSCCCMGTFTNVLFTSLLIKNI